MFRVIAFSSGHSYRARLSSFFFLVKLARVGSCRGVVKFKGVVVVGVGYSTSTNITAAQF